MLKNVICWIVKTQSKPTYVDSISLCCASIHPVITGLSSPWLAISTIMVVLYFIFIGIKIINLNHQKEN
jgi:hypothetical protein